MIFITTFTKEIYEICGKRLLQSFIETENNKSHTMVIFFEDKDNPHTENYPEWLVEWSDKNYFHFVNIMNYELEDGIKPVDYVDSTLKSKISFTDEYSSPRSVKWFRPVAAIHCASSMITDGKFSSIDADCLFIKKVEDEFFDGIIGDNNIAYLGREGFKTMRHGGYDNSGRYVHTRTVDATKKDTHTETGYIGFNLDIDGTRQFIQRNFDYWMNGDVLNLEFKTDCHTFDATRKELNLKYNNLCEPMGDTSPIGSRVIEESLLGEFLTHNKGTIGPILYQRNLV